MDVRFKTPANFYVCGQTQAGKSHLTRRMLRHLEELFYPVPTKIIYCYGEYQKKFDELPSNVELMEGLPDNLNDMVRDHDSSLVVLDDLMSECSNDQRVADLFTRGSHHRGISVLYLTQNLFPPGKLSRTISLNSHYFVIFRNPRDSLGISTIHTYIHKILFRHASPNNKNAGFHGGREDRVTDTWTYSMQKKKHTHAYK